MADNISSEPAVDETPISPIERQNSLEKHLQMRPDAKDLKDRHILLDTNAAPYVIRFLSLQILAEATGKADRTSQGPASCTSRTRAESSNGQLEEGVGEETCERGVG